MEIFKHTQSIQSINIKKREDGWQSPSYPRVSFSSCQLMASPTSRIVQGWGAQTELEVLMNKLQDWVS